MLSSIDLWHNLSEKQQHEGEQYGNHDKLQPIGCAKIYHMGKEIVTEHDDGNIHKIVGNENRCQCTF